MSYDICAGLLTGLYYPWFLVEGVFNITPRDQRSGCCSVQYIQSYYFLCSRWGMDLARIEEYLAQKIFQA